MDRLTMTAAGGMRARMESLEMLANNLANVSTAGYKVDRESYSLYVAPEAMAPDSSDASRPATTLPLIERQWTDLAQGVITPTGNPLDLAISGKGFFAVSGPAGALYTRHGGFRLSSKGVLETKQGYAVRATGGRLIEAEPGKPLDISSDGIVRQAGRELGQLEIVDLGQSSGLEKRDGLYFKFSPGSGTPPQPSSAEVVQGKLESSNVGAAESAVRLVGVLRQFETLQRALALGGEMNRRGFEEVAKVNP